MIQSSKRMTYLNAVLATTAATATAAAATGAIVARFAATTCAFDLERVTSKVDTVHLVNGIVGIARIFKL